MTKLQLTDKEIVQLRNVTNTLIEATDHFRNHVKDRYLIQSINIFSSIVEGFQAIQTVSVTYQEAIDQQLILNIEKDLILISQNLEEKKLMKILEIIQFSLLPKFTELHESFSIQKSKHKLTIGVYHDQVNPIELYPEDRITALNSEAERQGVSIIYFSSEDVDLKNKRIKAKTYANNSWHEVESMFPDVINNTGVSNRHMQSITERKLRRIIPFTSFHVGNKLYLPKLMVKQKRFADLLIPFKMVNHKQVVYDYLDTEKIVVAKPILGARGENIYFIQKRGNRFTITDHNHERIYNKDNFDEWIDNTLLKRKLSYMVQQYVSCRTKDREPYDIRAHMQKDRKGKWTITKIYPRIGNSKSILSNISKGGRTEELQDFLITQFSQYTGNDYYNKLRNLSVKLTEYLDRLHNFSLDELGLDLAIDETGRFWLHEVNNGPQSTYHEAERAVNTIGYAKYIAKNGIVKQNQFTIDKGQFNAKKSDLPFVEVDERYRIGMLKAKNSKADEKLSIACAYVAHYENVEFYTFSPEDVDYNEMLIKGQFYENDNWVEKIIEYPHVIYDRLRLRDLKQFNRIYEELEGIPFNNEFYGNSISKLEVYDKLKASGKLDNVLIPYRKIERVEDIFQYIDEFNAVIIKPEVGSFAKGVHYLSKLDNNKYFVAEGNKETNYTEIDLRRYLNILLEKNTFIVQQYIKTRTIDGKPFDLRIHMMKNRENDWDFVHIYPRIGVHYAVISATTKGGYVGSLNGFLERNYSNMDIKQLEKNIKLASKKITNVFSSIYTENFNEIAFDFALDKNANLHLIELNINKPGILLYEFDLARIAIPNAIHLAKSNKDIFSY